MDKGTRSSRCYRLVKALLQGGELDRHAVAKLLGVEPAAADRHMKSIVATVPGVVERRHRRHRTIRYAGDAAPTAVQRSLAAAACFGASLARLFRGTPYETRLDEVRDGVVSRTRMPDDFGDARRKFLFITPAGEAALLDHRERLDDLVEAVLKGRRLCMDYTPFDGAKRKGIEVEPWSIAIYDHQLYLLGKAEGFAPRAYRLSRIGAVRVLPSTFRYPSRSAYDPEQTFRDTFGIFIRGEDPVEDVVLRLAPRWRTYAHSHQWHSSQRVSDESDGSVVVRMRVRACLEFEAFILRFGGDAEVLGPGPLRERIARQAEALHRKYAARPGAAADGAAQIRRAQEMPVYAEESLHASSRRPAVRRRRARGSKPPAETAR